MTGVAIVLQDYKEVYVSTREKRSGEKVPAEDFKPTANSFAIPVSDPVSDKDFRSDIHLPIPRCFYMALLIIQGAISQWL